MMRAKDNVVTAVRDPHGKIVYRKERVGSLARIFPFRLLFFRGIVSLFETLIIGIKSLNYSADVAMHDGKRVESTKKDWFLLAVSMLFSFAVAIAIFKLIPLALTQVASGFSELFSNRYVFNIVEGLLKLGIFIGYVLIIGRMKDIRRVFQYHGAEHKAVSCHEIGKKLTVENCRPLKTLHPRCGTAFVMIVLIVSILVFSLIPVVVLHYFPGFAALGVWTQKLILFPVRIAFLPVIAGIGYELLKVAAKHEKNILAKILIFPGLLLQKITTAEPDDKQLEVAIKAMKLVISMQK